MKADDLSLIAQLVASIDSVVQRLEDAVEKKNVEQIKKMKNEILNLQREMTKLIGNGT